MLCHSITAQDELRVDGTSSKGVVSSYLVQDESLDSYNEYDYCEVIDRQETPTNEQPSTQKHSSLDQEQDQQCLRYYIQHVHTICDTVKLHISRLEDIVASTVSKQALVACSRLLVSTAHKLVYIGDTLSRIIRQPLVQAAISDIANRLCNVLKDYIMVTKEAALSQQAFALNKLKPSVQAIEAQTESFRNVIRLHANTK